MDKSTNVLGLLGLIIALLAELFFIFGSNHIGLAFIGGILLIAALVLSIIGLTRKPKVLAIIGLCISGLELLAVFILGLFLVVGLSTEDEFSTVTGTIDGHDYVDLGLSVKWATYNVGATKPEEYGDYFAWGEIETKSNYLWHTYKWCKGSENTLTKYNAFSSYGTVDNKTTLDDADDIAHVKWGGSWRMPTKAELEELRSNCTWTYTTMNDVNGYLVTSEKSGYTDRSIFLPAAGYSFSTNLSWDSGDLGFYWSSSLNTDNSDYAYYLDFGLRTSLIYGDRYGGYSVRPVCP